MPTQDYQQIATVVELLKDSTLDQASLDTAADQVGLNPPHFRNLFKRFAGVSPKHFLQSLTCEHIKQLLQQSETVFGPNCKDRLGQRYDLQINVAAATPKEKDSAGQGLTIFYGIHVTLFGDCLLAKTEQGICRLEFVSADTLQQNLADLQAAWPEARLIEDRPATQSSITRIFTPQPQTETTPIRLLLRGSEFQLKVWKTLLTIPFGAISSYGKLARQLGQPTASRAVGTAIGQNPIGYLIPCHRVLRSDGQLGGYRWGVERKRIILGYEFNKRPERAN